MTEQLTAEQFRPHVAKVFRVRGCRHDLTLTALEEFDVSEAQRQLVLGVDGQDVAADRFGFFGFVEVAVELDFGDGFGNACFGDGF